MIQEIKINRFTVLRDLQHDFAGKSVLVCGKNALGKSSLLKFCRIALGETDCIAPGIEIDGELVKTFDGKEYKFSVKMDHGKPKVTVTGPDGMSDSRKGVIANITGALNFDITEFVTMSKTEKGRKEQVELFKSFFPKEMIEFIDKMEANGKVAFDDRTQLNNDVKAKEFEVNTNPLNSYMDKALDEFKEVDISATMEDLKTLQAHNKKVQDIIDRKVSREAQIADLKAQIATIEKLVDDANTYLSQPANKIQDTVKYEEIIKNATKSNKDYADAQKLKKDRALLETMKAEAENATINIESQREAIKQHIKEMTTDMVPGLTFDENGLVYNGLLVHPDTHSTSQRIKLGMLMKIAQNKDIGVLFLENLESVDEDGLKAIMELAEEAGMQVIGEEVRRGQSEMTFEIIGN